MGKYDKVRIVNAVDGSVIEGHEAVEAYFAKEQKLLDAHGATLNFQLYRANMSGKTRAEIQGPRLAEHKIAGARVSGTDTVAQVKALVLPILCAGQPPATYVAFVVSGREMRDDKLFYADHFLMLPTWIQVLSSEVPFSEFIDALMRAPATPA
ncbi:MAG TPA: hypothetical protein VGM39_20780 [Kofleriaceae bacterium]